MELLKEKDTRIAFLAWIIILASIPISALVFHKDPTPLLLTVGFFFLICIPWYVVYRIRQNRNEKAAKDEVQRVIRECAERLDEVWDDVIRIKESKSHKSKLEKWEEVEEGMWSIRDNLRDLQGLMATYGFFYENIQRRNAIDRLKKKGIPIVRETLEKELKNKEQ